MNNLGRRLVRLEARLQPPEDKITQHIIHFVEGDGTVTGSMVINFGQFPARTTGWPQQRAPK